MCRHNICYIIFLFLTLCVLANTDVCTLHISYIPLFFPFLGSYGCRRGLKSTKNGQVWRLFWFCFKCWNQLGRNWIRTISNSNFSMHCNTFTFFGHYGSQEMNAMAESQVHKTMYHVMQIFFQTMPGGNCYQNVKLWKKMNVKSRSKWNGN